MQPVKSVSTLSFSVKDSEVLNVFILQVKADTFYIFKRQRDLVAYKRLKKVHYRHTYIGVTPKDFVFVFVLDENDRFKTAKLPVEKALLNLQKKQKVNILLETIEHDVIHFNNTKRLLDYLSSQ